MTSADIGNLVIRVNEFNLHVKSCAIVKMAREGLPSISRPLPVLLQGLEYDDIPLEPRPKESSAFEKPSLSYSWLHALWTNIISAKWAGNLLPIIRESSAPVQSYDSGPLNMPKTKPSISNPRRPGLCKLLIITMLELYHMA